MRGFYPFEEEDETPKRLCEHPDCLEPGEFRAPKSRHNLREYYHFCLEHVREYNAKWNFFEGFSQEQIYEQYKRDTTWERPSWPAGIPQKLETRLNDFIRKFTKGGKTSDASQPRTALTKEAQAYETLGLSGNVDQNTVKARYRELVKRYHPDKNPDNPKAADRFKIVSEAYMIIQASWQGKL